MTTGVGEVGTGTIAGDVTAVSDVDDLAVVTDASDVGTGTSTGDVMAASDVDGVR